MYSNISKYFGFRKYDASAQLDRSDTSVYPDGYVCSLSSRVMAVCRGNGAAERDIRGRERGGKTPFLPIRRPKILNLRLERILLYFIFYFFEKLFFLFLFLFLFCGIFLALFH